jgi:hypothetical protein
MSNKDVASHQRANATATEVTQVFNDCNETSWRTATGTDLKRNGSPVSIYVLRQWVLQSIFEHIVADTIQRVCIEQNRGPQLKNLSASIWD